MFRSNSKDKRGLFHPNDTVSAANPQSHLIHFLGGAGKEVGLEMRADPELQSDQSVKGQFLDSDPTGLENLGADEKYLFGNVPGADLLQAIKASRQRGDDQQQYPGNEILGHDLDDLERKLQAGETLRTGAKTATEVFDLECLFHTLRHPDELFSFLTSAARKLLSRHQLVRCGSGAGNGRGPGSPSKWPAELVISLMASPSGGTGGGLFFFALDTDRHLLKRVQGLRNIRFEADILLAGPLVHKALDPMALLANTHKFFLKLLIRYQRRLPPQRLAWLEIERPMRPLDWCYVYDEISVGLTERIYPTRRQVAQVVKAVWELRNRTPGISAEYRARLEDLHLSYPDICSSGGAAIVEYPAGRMVEQLAYRLGAEVIRAKFLQTLPEDEARELAQARLRALLNQEADLRDLPGFHTDAQGKPVQINLQGFRALARPQLPRALENFTHGQCDQWQTETLEHAVAKKSDRLGKAIVTELAGIYQLHCGLDLGGYFLAELDAFLQGQQAEVDKQLERARKELNVQQQHQATRRQKRWRLSLTPRQDFLDRYQRLLESHFTVIRWTARLKLINNLRQGVVTLQEERASWWQTLTDLARLIEMKETEFVRQEQARQSVVVWCVLCPEDIEALWQERRERSIRLAADGLSLNWVSDEQRFRLHYSGPVDGDASNSQWEVLSPEGISRHHAYCLNLRCWQDIWDTSLEQWLLDRGWTGEALLAELEERGAPLIATDVVKQIPAERRIQVLGCERGEAGELFRGYVGKTGLVITPTGDRHRIALLSTVHGFSPFKLMQAPVWEEAHQYKIAQGHAVDAVPEADVSITQQADRDGEGLDRVKIEDEQQSPERVEEGV